MAGEQPSAAPLPPRPRPRFDLALDAVALVAGVTGLTTVFFIVTAGGTRAEPPFGVASCGRQADGGACTWPPLGVGHLLATPTSATTTLKVVLALILTCVVGVVARLAALCRPEAPRGGKQGKWGVYAPLLTSTLRFGLLSTAFDCAAYEAGVWATAVHGPGRYDLAWGPAQHAVLWSGVVSLIGVLAHAGRIVDAAMEDKAREEAGAGAGAEAECVRGKAKHE